MDAVRDRYPEHFRRFGAHRLPMIAVATAMFALLLFGMDRLGFFDGKLLSGIGRLVEIAGLMLPPDPGVWAHARAYGMALIETVAIALLGTLSAAILALPVGLLAARNVTAQRIVRFLARRSLDTIRSVDILIWALIWINVVGLGPFAGALAIMTSDIGSFGKLFSEAIEAADRKPVRRHRLDRRQSLHRHPLRHPARGLSRAGEPGPLLLRIQHPLGHHHRHRRRRRHRPASRRSDPDAGAAADLLHHPDDPGYRGGDRPGVQPAPLRHDRSACRVRT